MQTNMNFTSLEAYGSIKEKLQEKEKQVISAIKQLGGKATNKQIAKFLGWEINRVTGRVNSLHDKKGILKADGIDRSTGRAATVWAFKTILLLLMPFFCSGQLMYNHATNRLEYTEVFEFDSMSAQELRVKTKDWFALKFNSARDVITSSTPNMVTGRYLNRYMLGSEWSFYWHTIIVMFKNNRMKVTITDMRSNKNGFKMESMLLKRDRTFRTGIYKKWPGKISEGCEATVQSLKTHINNKGDW